MQLQHSGAKQPQEEQEKLSLFKWALTCQLNSRKVSSTYGTTTNGIHYSIAYRPTNNFLLNIIDHTAVSERVDRFSQLSNDQKNYLSINAFCIGGKK